MTSNLAQEQTLDDAEWGDHLNKNIPNIEYPGGKAFSDFTQIQGCQPLIFSIFMLQSRYMNADLIGRIAAKFRQRQWVKDAAWKVLSKTAEKDKEQIMSKSLNPYVIKSSAWWYNDAGNKVSSFDTFLEMCHELL